MTILKTIQEHVEGKKLVVMEHKNPDVDSILSGYIFAKYLREHGVPAEFVIPDKIITNVYLEVFVLYKIYSNELKQTGIEFYTRYLTINNANHLETLFALKNDGYSHNYFCDIFLTTEEFMHVINIDPSVYSKSGWRY